MRNWQAIDREILQRLDIRGEAEARGVLFAAKEPSESGWLSCHAVDRADANPSAAICVSGENGQLGRYKDHGGDGKSCNFWELCVLMGRFDNWREAREHYAARAGVTLPKTKAGNRKVHSSVKEVMTALVRQHGKPMATWQYHDMNREVVGAVVRWDRSDGTKVIRPVTKCDGGWKISGMPEPRFLYRAAALVNADRVFVCEGEKCCDAVMSIGLTATTSVHGSKSPHKSDWSLLAGKKTIILPDNDAVGESYAETVAKIVTKLKPSAEVWILRLPDLPPGGDIVDWIDAHEAAEPDELKRQLEELADAAPKWTPGESSETEAVVVVDPVPIGDLMVKHPELRPHVIKGLVRKGETCNIIAPAKKGKTWLTYNLSLDIVSGGVWFGEYECEEGRVLIIDNELHVETIAHRIPLVAESLGISPSAYHSRIDVMSLRGRLIDYYALGESIDAIKPDQYIAVIVDSHYRMYPEGVSENDNAQIARVYNIIDQYAEQTQAAWFLIHHVSKGSQSDKTVVDVGAGAGSQARATDTHIILRPHQEPDHVVMEAAVRSWPPVEPITLRWSFPVWHRTKLAPTLRRQPTRAQERQQQADAEATREILDSLLKNPGTARDLRAATKLSRERAGRLLDILEADGHISFTMIKKRGNECKLYAIKDVGDETAHVPPT